MSNFLKAAHFYTGRSMGTRTNFRISCLALKQEKTNIKNMCTTNICLGDTEWMGVLLVSRIFGGKWSWRGANYSCLGVKLL